jgi:hypothetical protein
MTEKKKMEIVFAPGCFDNFEGTQEELDELMAEILTMFESGDFIEKSRPLSEETLEEMDDEEIAQIAKALDYVENEENPQRKLH